MGNDIFLTNNLSNKKEKFVPIDEKNIIIKSVIKGDQLIPEISAASIIAKVYRDKLMCDLANKYPEYGFERHMGYPTKVHMEALSNHGVLDIHRKSFAPVRKTVA